MKFLFFLIAAFGLTNVVKSQIIDYEKYYQEDYEIEGMDLLHCNNGDYLMSGFTINDDNADGVNFYTNLIDKDGNNLRTIIYGDSLQNYLQSSCELSNGYFAFTGYSREHTGDSKFTILLTSNEGDSLWMKSHGQGTKNLPYKIIESNDGNLVIVGHSGETFYRKSSMSKLDLNGNLIWEKTIGWSGENLGLDVVELENGDFFISGWSKSGNTSGYLIKVNSEGEQIWDKKISLNGSEICTDIELSDDGNLLVGGFTGGPTSAVSRVPILYKIDYDGNILWQREYMDMENYGWGAKIIQDESSNIFLLGSSEREGSVNLWFMKLNREGVEEYRTFFGDESNNWPDEITKLEGNSIGVLAKSNKLNTTTNLKDRVLYRQVDHRPA